MVWQAAQLSENRSCPADWFAPARCGVGTAGTEGSSELTQAASSSACTGVSRDGLRSASTDLTSVAGMRPVLTQKSTVAAPTPCRFGPMVAPPVGVTPLATLPWQLEQVWANSRRPADTNAWGGLE